jgi:predicted nuclease with TOPRIM domain
MVMTKEKATRYLVFVLLAGCLTLGVLLNFKNTALQKAKLKSGVFEKQYKESEERIETLQARSEALEQEINIRDKRIEELIKQYNELPTDKEIVYQDATLVDANTGWSVLLRAAEIADDSTFFQP